MSKLGVVIQTHFLIGNSSSAPYEVPKYTLQLKRMHENKTKQIACSQPHLNILFVVAD